MSSRSAELRALIRLALPLMGAQMLQMSMGALDAVMAGRRSPEDLAGVILGGNVFWPSLLLLSGVVLAVTPTIAQLHGAGKIGDVGEVVRQGAWVALVATATVIALIQQAEVAYAFVGADPAAAAIAARYLDGLSVGAPGLMSYFLLRYLCEGLGRTRPALFIVASALVLKAPLNYAFIYGAWGAPELGGAGCGWASAIVQWFECAAMLYVVTRRDFHATRLFARFSWPDPRAIARLARLGLPIGATQFFEAGVFSITGVLLGGFGAEVVAGHGVAGNLNGFTFMIPLALGVAVTIRVGFHVGAGAYEKARATAQVAMASTVVYALLAGALLFALREQLAWVYTRDADVWALAADLIIFVAAYQLVDDTQAVAIGALRGYKDTRTPMWIALTGYWVVAFPIACALGYGWLTGVPLAAYGFWTGLTVGLGFVALLVSWRLSRLSRDFARVASLSSH
jgi:MATE family multidrug resistance protein